jgi:hypothetical protein
VPLSKETLRTPTCLIVLVYTFVSFSFIHFSLFVVPVASKSVILFHFLFAQRS